MPRRSRGTAGPRRRAGREKPVTLPPELLDTPEDLRPPAPDSPRGRILAAAREAFAAHGFGETSTRAIAAAAGVNQAMIHYYFGSKAALYRRVLAGEILALFGSVAGRVLGPGEPASAGLLALPHAIVEGFRGDRTRLALVRRELGEGAASLRQVVAEMGPAGPRGYRELLRRRIEQARAAGELVDAEPDAILTLLLSHAYGLVLMEPLLRLVLGMAEGDEKAWKDLLRAQRSLLSRALGGADQGERA